MPSLFVHKDAEADLEALWDESQEAAARLAVLLQELQTNRQLLDWLTQHDFGCYGSADFHVSKWFEHWNKGKALWRLKVWDLENRGLKYRNVYAFVPMKQHYYVLAIAPRDFNYDANHWFTRRILSAYEDL